MKLFFFLVSFSVFISSEVTAQADSLISKDSIPVLTATIPDSVRISGWGPWSGDPYLLQIDWSKFSVTIPALESPYTPKGAKKDIRKGKPEILFWGGMTGDPDFSSEEDKAFQRKYGVKFFCQGCIRMNNNDQEGYNQVIFAYLDKKHGTDWRYELPKGAVAFDYPKVKKAQTEQVVKTLSSLSIQFTNPQGSDSPSLNPETENSVWWYILPTSGFALLLSLFLIIKRRKKK
ncbi:MAG: LPXTG cell wall anchor domain-containing protein [Fluviicola sp.]